jgi:hypothetical protein
MMHETRAKQRAGASRWGAWCVTAALAAALSATAAGGRADGATLRWKFKPGEALHYQMDQKTVTQIKANGQEIKTTLSQTIDSTWTVESVGSDGAAEMAQTLDRVRTKIESAFGALEYDSAAGKDPEGPIAAGVVPLLKALVGAKFRYKMNPQGELSDVKVPDGLVQKLKEAGPAAANVSMFSEEGLKNLINQSSLSLPKEDLTKDKTWVRESKIPAAPIGTMTLEKTYKYDGPAEGGEKIGLSVKMGLEPTPGNNIDVKVGDQKGEGSFIFDNTAGRVASSTVTEKMEMIIKVMNQEVNQSTDSTSSMKLIDVKAAGAKPAGESK